MPVMVNDHKVFSLKEVADSIQHTLTERYKTAFWVKAEMNKLNLYKHSGHCYPELVEKKDGKVIAQFKAIIWKTDFARINHQFQQILKEPLKDGIKILFLAKISFETSHGLSLIITDTDPEFTLGDLEREKQETIKQLHDAGIFFQNKKHQLPLLPQRIAIISVETSKGYADFIKVLETNPWNYKFFHFIFPSLLQGDNTVQSISNQLRIIKKVKNHFDVVAIIRGGGGDVGLSCYNNYLLAKEIALFPLPIITGIGHATNETVAEMISFTNAITPTKLAEFIIQQFHNFSIPVQNAEKKIMDKSGKFIQDEKIKFNNETKLFQSVTKNMILAHRNDLKIASTSLNQLTQFTFINEYENLNDAIINLRKETQVLCYNTSLEIKQITQTIYKDSVTRLQNTKNEITHEQENLFLHSKLRCKSSLLEVNNREKNIHNMSPANVLRRGYSLTRLNGKALTHISAIKAGDIIDTTIFEGHIQSIITTFKKPGNHE